MDIDPYSDFDPEEKNPNKPMHWTLIILYGSHALRGNSPGRSSVHKKTAERSRKAPTQSVGAIIKEGE
jgi:hypothetical protein